MKNITKRIIAIILTVTLAVTIYPAIGSVRAEAAPADKVEKTEAAKAETKKDTKKAKDQNTAEAGDVKTVGNTTIAGNGTAVSAGDEAEAGFLNVVADTDTKTVEVDWMGDVNKIVVNLYEDDYQGSFEEQSPVYVKSVDVSPSADDIVTTDIALGNGMPEYFILEVLLQDSSGNDAAEPYLSNAYSESIRSISETTAEDYRHEGDRLVEMAADSGVNDGSFMLLADDVLRIEEGAGGTEGAEGAGGVLVELEQTNGGEYFCTLENVDNELARQLKDIDKNDPVFIIDKTYDGGETATGYHMFTADGASVDSKDGSAVLRGSMEEGIDENGNSDIETLGTFLKATNVTASEKYEVPIEGFPIGSWGTLTMDIKGELKVSFVGNFGVKERSISISVINDIECSDTEVDIDLPTATKDIPIVEVPIVVTGVVNFEFIISLRFSGTATGGVRFDINMRTGMEVGSRLGWGGLDLFVNNKSTMPTTQFRGFSLQGSVFVGFAGGLSVNVFKIFGVAAELESGLVITGTLTSGHYWDGGRKYHACKDFTCLDGDVSYKLLGYSLSVSAGIFSKGVSGDFMPTVQITPFYYSGTYDDSAATNCPHWGYRLYVHVKDHKGKAVAGAEVSYSIDDTQYESLSSAKTNSEGVATLYLPKGEYDINVSYKDDKTGHTFESKGNTFNEEGYSDEGDLITSDYYVTLNTSCYELSFIDLDQSGKAEKMPSTMYAYGGDSEKTIPDVKPIKDGRTFVGWATKQGSTEVKYEPGDSITVDQDKQLYAVWAYEEYTIKFDPNKPGNASHDIEGQMTDMDITYEAESSSTLNKNGYTLTGWEFTGWSTTPYAFDPDAVKYEDEAVIPHETLRKGMKQTITLYAQWEPKPYEVTYVDEDGTNIRRQGIYYDTPTQLLSAEYLGLQKADHVFTHWSRDVALGSNYADKAVVTNLCNVNEDGSLTGHTLTANWVETDGATIIIMNDGQPVDIEDPENSIKLKAEGGNTEYSDVFEKKSPGIYSIKGASEGKIPAETYEVIFTEAGGLAGYDAGGRTIEVDESAGAYNFDYYTVEISCDEHGTSWIGEKGKETAEKVLRGTKIAIGTSVPENSGYHFESYTALDSAPGWGNDDPTIAEQTITVTGQTQIEAHTAANLYQVVFHANDGETEWTITQDMVYDEPQKLFANQFERYGYTFAGWTETAKWQGGDKACDYGDRAEVKNLTAVNGESVDLYAQWNPVPVMIEFYPNGDDVKGTMLDQETFYESGTILSECEFIRPHWGFIGWNTEPDGSGISYPDKANYVSHNIDEKDEEGNAVLKLYAQWEPTEYTIGYDLAGGTVLEGNPTTYNIETEEFTLKNPERVGYIFLGWTGSNGDKPEKKVTISKGSHGNRKYTANWKAEEKTLKFDPNGGEWEDGKTETLAKKADYDSTVTIPDAPAREHYTFEFWEDESGNKYIPGHEYKVRDDQEFKALWEPVQYVIEYDLAGGTIAEDANPAVYTTETDDFTLAAPERDGYIFLGWTGSNGDEPEKEVTIEKGSGGDKSYTANWEPVKTATSEDETKDKGTPTGDGFDPLLWGALLLSSAAVLAVLYGRRRRNR